MHLKVSLFYDYHNCVQLENRFFIGISSIGYLPGNKRFSIAGKITTLVKIIAPENGSSDGSTTNINRFKPIECVVSKMNTLNGNTVYQCMNETNIKLLPVLIRKWRSELITIHLKEV